MAVDSTFVYTVGFLEIPVFLFGIIGNTLSASVLSKPSMRSSINSILFGLAIADNLFLLSQFCLVGLAILVEYFDAGFWYLNYYQPLMLSCAFYIAATGQAASAMLTVAVSLERYIAVSRPFLARRICTTRNGVYLTLTTFVLCGVYAIPYYLKYEAYKVSGQPEYYNSTGIMQVGSTVIYKLKDTEFGMSSFYSQYKSWGVITVNFLFPFIALTVLNIGIVREIRRANRQRQKLTQTQVAEMSIAKMLMCVVLLYGICYTPGAISQIFWRIPIKSKAFEDLKQYFRYLSYLCEPINSAGNFIIYFAMNKNFRLAFRKILCFCGR